MNALHGSDAWPPGIVRVRGRDGLVGIGSELSSDLLLWGYRHGIFPWSENPVTWWSPDPRGVLPLDRAHIPRSLQKLMRKSIFTLTWNQAFSAVIAGCAHAHGQKNWISPGFIAAYTQLHREGWAVSVECWQNDELVGGIYGVLLHHFFAGESMFHTVPNASKAALVHLMDCLRERHCRLFDIQMVTPATASLGAEWIPRARYLRQLREALGYLESEGGILNLS